MYHKSIINTIILLLLSKNESGDYQLFGKYRKTPSVDEGTSGFLSQFTTSEFKNMSKDDFDIFAEAWTQDNNLSDNVKEFFEAVKDGKQDLKDSDNLIEEFGKSAMNAKGGITGLRDGVKSFLKSIGSSALNILKSFGAGLVNAFASYVISSVVTNVVTGIYNKLSGKEEKELRDKGNKKFTERTEAYKEEIKTIDELESKYTELSEKLKDNTLSTSELLSVKSDLQELQAQMIEQYGAEASGISLVTGEYDKEIKKLAELRKAKAEEYLFSNDKGVTTKKDKNGKTNLDRALERVTSEFGGKEVYLSYNEGKENLHDYYGFDINSILKKYKDINVQGDEYGDMRLVISPTIDKKALNDQIVQLTSELKTMQDNPKVKELLDALGYVDIHFNSSKYEEAIKNIYETARAYMMLDTNDEGKTLEERAEEAVKKYNEAYKNALSNPSAENEKALQEAKDEMTSVGFDISKFKSDYFNDEDFQDIKPWFDKIFSDIWASQTKNGSQQIDRYFDNATGEIKSRYYELTKDLSEAEKLAFIDLLPEDAKILTINDIKDLIAQAQEIAENNPVEIKIKASAAVDSMAEMKSAVASLSDLYNQSVLQSVSENADSFATFAADPATLNSIESAFSKFIEEKSSSGSDVTELNAALEEFERIAVESYGADDYAQQMQDAIDELITAYIDQTDILKNLTEENKKWSEEQLTAMGITNAEDVVIDRLTKTQKISAKAWSLLTSTIEAYNDALSRGDETEKESQIKNLAQYLNDAFEDDTGITFDTEFVQNNIALIEDFINEVDGAREKLQQLAAQNYILHLDIEGDTNAVEYYRHQLTTLLNQFDGAGIEIGASLDGNQVIQEFIRIAKQAGLTAKDIQNALAKAGVKANIKYTRIPVANVSSISKTEQMAAYKKGGTDAVRNLMTKEVEVVDELTYEPYSKATTASYSAPSTSGSSSGGGGGGGSEPTKPKEESEETFDWIEVAIQRIEEEISRLDKVVGNSYDLWINRNEALVKEMEKTTEEIKAQQLAQSEYLRNANAVQVNNGKGLNDDDYGENDELVKANDQKLLDEARAAWATGEYQRKVREGQMSGDDIEKIQNHFLSETIQFYQELINKSIAAGDAVQDLQIKLGELARTNFDHVKSEYEELIQYITDSADIINEKINRTEEHGYFVSKSYYQDLLKLESGNLAYLEGEYEDLIKKRDEAVAAGYIKESSSEWNQMNQEINAVNKSIEESKTKTVELNNAIRQLEWDRFDWLEDRISKINEEASFLIDLMSNDQLYEDNGKLTGLGHSTNAMYAVQYETYMRQARDYAEERRKLEKEMAADPANKNLVERMEDLVSAQQDAIKGAEQMKDAVKSLVQEGILMPYCPVMGII